MLLSTLPWKSCKIKEFIIKQRLLYIKRVLFFQFSLEQQRHTKEQNYFMILYGHVVPSRVVNQTELCCLLTSLRPRVLAAPPRHPGHSDNSPRKHHYLMSLLALCSVKRTPPPPKKNIKACFTVLLDHLRERVYDEENRPSSPPARAKNVPHHKGKERNRKGS